MFVYSLHFSPFKLFLDRETGTAHMLNPKVMTTFTRDFLVDGLRTFRGRTDPSEGRWRVLSFPRRFPVAPASDYLRFLRDPGSFRLTGFVRNPYGRVLSAWRNKFLDPHTVAPGQGDHVYPRSVRWRHIRRVRRFARQHGMEGAEPGDLVPFPTFLAYAANAPAGRRDHHWESQAVVLMCDGLRYHRIYRIEDELIEGFVDLGNALGFDEAWTRSQLGTKKNQSRATNPVYTEALAAAALPLCSVDLAFFGYARDSWADY